MTITLSLNDNFPLLHFLVIAPQVDHRLEFLLSFESESTFLSAVDFFCGLFSALNRFDDSVA